MSKTDIRNERNVHRNHIWAYSNQYVVQIKADREEIHATEGSIADLQKQTSQALEDDHEHAKSK